MAKNMSSRPIRKVTRSSDLVVAQTDDVGDQSVMRNSTLFDVFEGRWR